MSAIKTSSVPLFIDGVATSAATGSQFSNVNPATGRELGGVALGGKDDVDRAVDAARRAQRGPWGRLPLERRLALLEAIAAAIEARTEELVAAEVADSGMPVVMARQFAIPRAAANLRSFARLAADMPGDSITSDTPDGRGALSYSMYVPLGVVGLICPWNLPLALLTWKLAPALAMGNTVVVKPSEETPTTATLLGEILKEVGIPDGVYNVVHGIGAGGVGEAICEHPDVSGVSFTGSTATGRAIMAKSASSLKKLSLELGGKNPAIIFADADIEQALPTVARSVFLHAGQICLCTERIYVERPLYDRFVDGLVQATGRLVPGSPTSPETTLGPLVAARQREKVLSYYQLARSEGGSIEVGGEALEIAPPHDGGFYVQPTVITGLPESSRCDRDEIFGPVCSVRAFDSEEEAIALANDSSYGLAMSLWTRDMARAGRMARQVDVGVAWLNTWLIRDLRTPFGGVKASGIGREGGRHSLDFFSELRSVTMKL